MTNNPLDFINRQFVGFDQLFDAVERGATAVKTYPPHNVIRLNDDHTRIELAVAGFTRADLEVVLENQQLKVTGSRSDPEDVEYLFRGISTRNFSKKWTLDRHLEVEAVKLENGVLTIDIVRNVPEAEKPKLLDIQ